MLQYTTADGQVHPNLEPDEAMKLFASNGYTGKVSTVEEPDVIEAEPQPEPPPTALVVATPVIEVISPAVVVEEEDEEEDFANMRGRKFVSPYAHTTKTLEEILVNLEDLKKKEDPIDYTRNIKNFLVKIEGDKDYKGRAEPVGQFLFRDGLGEPIKLNRKAYRDLCKELSGSGSIRYMDRLVKLPNGDKLATLNLAAFRQEADVTKLFRSALDKGGNRRHNALLSNTYSRYDNVDYIKDVLMCLGDEVKEWHVVRYNVRDGRLHVQLVHVDEAYLNRDLGVPVPAFTLKNGQYGDGSASINSSSYRWTCKNGMFSVHSSTKKGFNHTGDCSSRVKQQLPGVMEDIIVGANGLVDLDRQALEVEVNDAYALYEQMIGDAHSDTFKEQVHRTILSEPTVRGNGRLLSSIPDALTFLAHEQNDLGKQMELERLGGQLLSRGLQQAENNRIHIPLG